MSEEEKEPERYEEDGEWEEEIKEKSLKEKEPEERTRRGRWCLRKRVLLHT